MIKYIPVILFLLLSQPVYSQAVSVQADYNSMGDCLFSAYNNTSVPMFLNIKLADLENTVFTEPTPYVKMLEPGFTSLFTLQRDPDADVPRFNYEIKVFRSNPKAKVDLNFPYLLPFAENEKVNVFNVSEIDGFWGQEGLESWNATGFLSQSGKDVHACRNGIVVELVGETRNGEASGWYNTWTNCLTMLQEDGTLICYHHLSFDDIKPELGQKVYAGQPIGRISEKASTLVILIFHDSLFTKSPRFIIPQFVIGEKEQAILISSREYSVILPYEIVGLEMSAKEKRKILGKK